NVLPRAGLRHGGAHRAHHAGRERARAHCAPLPARHAAAVRRARMARHAAAPRGRGAEFGVPGVLELAADPSPLVGRVAVEGAGVGLPTSVVFLYSGCMSPLLDDIPLKIAARIRGERTARRWSLDDLAEKSNVSKAMISKIERAEASPTAAL